jgi:hypothetical protein
MKNQIILTDIDGVVLDWEYAFGVYMQQHGFNQQEESKRYGFDNHMYGRLGVNHPNA